MQYYYNNGGEVAGPFEKRALLGKNITASTLVWTEGMTEWMPAEQVPMLADILDGSYAREIAEEAERAREEARKASEKAKAEQEKAAREAEEHARARRQSTEAPRPGMTTPPPAPAYAQTTQPPYGEQQPVPHQFAGQQPPQHPYGSPQPVQHQFAGQQQPYGQPQYGAQTQPYGGQPQHQYAPGPQYVYQDRQVGPPVDAKQAGVLNYSVSAIILLILGSIGVVAGLMSGIWAGIVPIFVTIAGVFGLTKSNDAKSALMRGDVNAARAASGNAKGWCIGGWIAFGVSILIGILLIVAGIALVGATIGAVDALNDYYY